MTAEAVVGEVLGPIDVPTGPVLGRLHDRGWLRVVGGTSPPPARARDELAARPRDRPCPEPEPSNIT